MGELEDAKKFLKENGAALVAMLDREAKTDQNQLIKSWMTTVTSTRVCSMLGLGYKKWYFFCLA